MLEIIDCKTAGELKCFFAFSKTWGYLPEEARYLRLFANPAVNPLRGNGPMKFLIAQRDGKTVGRILTYKDQIYNRASGMNNGFFSLFEAVDAEAANALLNSARKSQEAWGSRGLIGPVSPDGSGFFLGLPENDSCCAALTGRASEGSQHALEEAGFVRNGAYLAFVIKVPDKNELSEVAEKASARFGMRVECFRGLMGKNRLAYRIAEATEVERRADLMREFDRIRKMISGKHCFAVVKDGVCQGYLITLKAKGALLRVTTLETKKGAYTPAVCAMLLSALIDSMMEAGVKKAAVSVIDEANTLSSRLTKRFEIVRKCKIWRYGPKIEII